MTNREILEMLAESQALLNQATQAEESKRAGTTGTDLSREIATLSRTARDAHAKASKRIKDLEDIIGKARNGINRLMAADKGRERRTDNSIYQEINQAVDDMETAHQVAREEIEQNRARLGTFNLTLFGRTGSGKSTLMEILTDGDGRSIGKGAQQTTRDVREYPWNGMKVTDVPGVAAYDGEIDEATAYDATKQADLIIFLITDGAPQPVEAEHLARLKTTGNPILGICNVKRSVGEKEQTKLFLARQDDLFDAKRLADLTNQLDEMAATHGAGMETTFKFTHLRSRFLAGRPKHRVLQVELASASRFSDVEEHIAGEVSTNGRFHRKRSFLEAAHRATYEAWQEMLAAGTNSYLIHDRLNDHVRETKAWRNQFQRDAQTRTQSALNTTTGRLRREIPGFAEDQEINRAWQQKVQSANIDHRAREAQEELQNQVSDKIRTLTEDIGQEIKSVQTRLVTTTIAAGRIRDHRKIWNWGAIGVSGALGVAAAAAAVSIIPPLAPFALPLAIAAGAVGIVGKLSGRFFGNSAKRRQEAVARIRPELERHLDQLETQLRRDLDVFVRTDLLGTHVNGAIDILETLADSASQAAKFYRQQAEALNEMLLDMNRELFTAALEHAGGDPCALDSSTVARSPGRAAAVKPGDDTNPTSQDIMRA